MHKLSEDQLQIYKNLVYLEQDKKKPEKTKVTCVTSVFVIPKPIQEVLKDMPKKISDNLITLHYHDNDRPVALDKTKIQMIFELPEFTKVMIHPNGMLNQIKESKKEIEEIIAKE